MKTFRITYLDGNRKLSREDIKSKTAKEALSYLLTENPNILKIVKTEILD